MKPIVVAGGVFDGGDRVLQRLRQEIAATDEAHPHVVVVQVRAVDHLARL